MKAGCIRGRGQTGQRKEGLTQAFELEVVLMPRMGWREDGESWRDSRAKRRLAETGGMLAQGRLC